MPRVHVALGGNIDPQQRLVLAARELRRHFPDARFSSCYRNPPFGFAGDDFYNAAAGFDTEQSIAVLLPQFYAIEAACGRRRDAPKWAPRAMDIDLLLYGDVVADTAAYRLPRPDLLRRGYMLAPMAELAPQLRHPLTGRTMEDHWRQQAQEPHVMERLSLDLNAPH